MSSTLLLAAAGAAALVPVGLDGDLLPALLVGVVFALLATPLCARLAGALGWVDRSEGAEAARKLQARPVPAVGGLVVLAGLAVVWASLELSGGHWDPAIAAWIDPWAGAASLLLAFLAGALDDRLRGGLSVRAKLSLQALAGAPAAISAATFPMENTGLLESTGPAAALLAAVAVVLAAVIAQNAFNTFDNADGATTSLAILALGFHAPVFAGPLLGFLPWNLNAPREGGARATPTAYLGDAGSHLLGMLILLVPAAWPALALPLFDLARLAVKRWRAGSRPWIGDRRHLAHRLARTGLPRAAVCALLALVALPAIAAPGAPGLALTGLAFALAVGATRDPVSGPS